MQGALKNLGYYISDQTVGNVLKKHGIEPAPDRQKKTTWSKFLKAHWEVMGAVDFTTVEVWSRSGLTTLYILVVMKLSTRRIEIAGITPNPDAAWVQQMGRNLTDCYDGFLLDTRFLLIDRDTKFCPLRGVLEGTDTEEVLLPARSPNLNAYIERYMRSMKDECLNKMIFLGEKSLRRALGCASIQNSQDQLNHVLQNKGFEHRPNILTTRARSRAIRKKAPHGFRFLLVFPLFDLPAEVCFLAGYALM